MTVNPGFGGQKLIPAALGKVPVVRRMLRPRAAIELDGGIHRDNIRRVVEMGANWIVAGSAVFGAADPGGRRLRAGCGESLMAGGAGSVVDSSPHLRVRTDIGLRGRVRFPTGGDSPRALQGRPGEIPGPTVKVWRREDRSASSLCRPLGHEAEGFFVGHGGTRRPDLERAFTLAEKGRGLHQPQPGGRARSS